MMNFKRSRQRQRLRAIRGHEGVRSLDLFECPL